MRGEGLLRLALAGLVVLVALLAALAVRRAVLQRRGRAFDCNVRLGVSSSAASTASARPGAAAPTWPFGPTGTAGSHAAGVVGDPAGARGWMLGLARYSGDRLEWYRVFSWSLRPRVLLPRHQLVLLGRRSPAAAEAGVLPPAAVVLSCRVERDPLDLGLGEDALPGLLAWLEAAPPGRADDVA